MPTRSPEHAPTDPTQDAIRDDLPRDVLSYAEGLRREMYVIARRYGVEKPADIGPKIESGEVSLADMERMIELKKALEKAVAEKKIPFRLETFLESLGEIAETFVGNHWYADLIDRLPPVPHEQLLSRETFMQDVLDAMRSAVPEPFRDRVGRPASLVMNRLMATMPPEIRAHVRQTVRVHGVHEVGFRWAGGTLTVEGVPGRSLGWGMVSGIIRARHAGEFAGAGMEGGLLEITGESLVESLGSEMRGGEIRAKYGGNNVGSSMEGGMIRVQYAGVGAGLYMKGGEIEIAVSAFDQLGSGMIGGKITAAEAFKFSGLNMKGGEIRLVKGESVGHGMKGGMIKVVNAEFAGSEMHGGRIEVEFAKKVGDFMDDGTILVTGHAEIVGELMGGGEIILKGSAAEIVPLGRKSKQGLIRYGGTIRYDGPWAWWKNLFV